MINTYRFVVDLNKYNYKRLYTLIKILANGEEFTSEKNIEYNGSFLCVDENGDIV